MDLEQWVLSSEPDELLSEYAERLDLWARGFGAPVIEAPTFWGSLIGAVLVLALGHVLGGPVGGDFGRAVRL